MTGENGRFPRTLGGRCDEGISWRGCFCLARRARLVFAANVGSESCLQAVGSECGLFGHDCGPKPRLVGVECEPKMPLVCGFGCRCLQAATPIPRHYEPRFDHVPPPITEELRLSPASTEVWVIC